MQDQVKTPNKRKSMPNGGTPFSTKKQKNFTPNKSPNKSPFNKSPINNSPFGKKTPKSEKKTKNFGSPKQQKNVNLNGTLTDNKPENKRKSLPAKTFEVEAGSPPKKQKLQMFAGIASLESPEGATTPKAGKTPKADKTPRVDNIAVVENTPKGGKTPKGVKTPKAGQTPKGAKSPKEADSPLKPSKSPVAAGNPQSPGKKNKKNKKGEKGANPFTVAVAGGPMNDRQKKRLKTKHSFERKVQALEKAKESIQKGDNTAHLAVQEIAQKVAVMESKGELTKTGKRRLRDLKKLLELAEGKNIFANKVGTNKVGANKGETNKVQANRALTTAAQPNKDGDKAIQGKKLSKAEKKRLKKLEAEKKGDVVEKKVENPQGKNKNQKKQENKQQQNLKQLNQQQGKGKQQKKEEVAQPEESEEESDEEGSDYEVEKLIKVDKVTKKMNQASDEEEDEGDSDEEDGFVDELAQESDEEGSDEEGSAEEAEDSDDELETPQPKKQKKGQEKPKQEKNKNQQKGKNEFKVEDLKSEGLIQKGQSRYVVFVGNLPYDAQKVQIGEHFQKAGEVAHIRIPTEKGTQKPRGFAYVEFKNEEAYQRALSLHHTFINGRRINVLYTQGGKKKPEDKKIEIKAKNFKLNAMRNKGMLAGSTKESQKRSVRRAKQRNFNQSQSDD